MDQAKAAASSREAAQTAAAAAMTTLTTQLDRQRLDLEAQLVRDQAAGSAGSPPA
jgi:hypothetical protein